MYEITSLHIDLQSGDRRKVKHQISRDSMLSLQSRSLEQLRSHLDLQREVKDKSALLNFDVGLFGGTPFPGGSVTQILGWQPAARNIIQSFIGDHWGAELKYAGYSQLNIRGRSKDYSYLVIHNDCIEIRDAQFLVGKRISERLSLLREELRDDAVKILITGVAGERQCPGAAIQSCTLRSMSGPGLGNVMASMNLLAIVVKGNWGVHIDSPRPFLKKCLEYRRDLGSAAQEQQEGYWDSVDLEHEVQAQVKKRLSCFNCSANCYVCYDFPGAGPLITHRSFIVEAMRKLGINIQLAAEIISECQEYGYEPISFCNTLQQWRYLTDADGPLSGLNTEMQLPDLLDFKNVSKIMDSFISIDGASINAAAQNGSSNEPVESGKGDGIKKLLGICPNPPQKKVLVNEYESLIGDVIGNSVGKNALSTELANCSRVTAELSSTSRQNVIGGRDD